MQEKKFAEKACTFWSEGYQIGVLLKGRPFKLDPALMSLRMITQKNLLCVTNGEPIIRNGIVTLPVDIEGIITYYQYNLLTRSFSEITPRNEVVLVIRNLGGKDIGVGIPKSTTMRELARKVRRRIDGTSIAFIGNRPLDSETSTLEENGFSKGIHLLFVVQFVYVIPCCYFVGGQLLLFIYCIETIIG
eukprot:TRINITY_DN109399_c0_g1_i1.p4 TRINITY_DN109399_c0_g1~~TRINITY_DN109399_c0_g1_i1.p4  ORF type:complete len:189 (+),score=4.08 TRINITY_DN109399_c0_g1_i1:1108-1674(+)